MDVDWLRALRRFTRFCTKHKLCISYVVGVQLCKFRVGLFQGCVMKLSSNYKLTVFFLLLMRWSWSTSACLLVSVFFLPFHGPEMYPHGSCH